MSLRYSADFRRSRLVRIVDLGTALHIISYITAFLIPQQQLQNDTRCSILWPRIGIEAIVSVIQLFQHEMFAFLYKNPVWRFRFTLSTE